jgi:hypothetical protein
MLAMNITNRAFRMLSLVLLVTLVVGFATPGRAEAIEPTLIIAIASAAAVVVILIVFLVVANMHESQQTAAADAQRYVACVESDVEPRACWALPQGSTVGPIAPPMLARTALIEAPQGQ